MAYIKIGEFNGSANIAIITSDNSVVPYNIRLLADDSLASSDNLTSGITREINTSGDGEGYIEIEPTSAIESFSFTASDFGTWTAITPNISTFTTILTVTDTLVDSLDLTGMSELTTITITGNSNFSSLSWADNAPKQLNPTFTITDNNLDDGALDTVINKIFNGATVNSVKSGVLAIDTTGISTASLDALTALMVLMGWTVNGDSQALPTTLMINNIYDLQAIGSNLTKNVELINNIDGDVTHGWGTDIPTYQLIIPTMTKGSVANISNGAISFGTTNCNVCGVYYNESKALVGFYVDSPTTLSGDMKQLLSQEYTQGTPSAVNFSISDSGGTLLLTFSTTPTGLGDGDWLEVTAGSGTGIVIGNSYQISRSGSTVTINGLSYNVDITGLKFKELNAATEYTSTDIKHYYLDFTIESTYATERAKLGNLFDLTDDAKLMPLVCNDDLMRIYYRSKIKPEDGIIAKTGFNPIGQAVAFTGNFDCKGYTISDCHVFSALTNVGIIGYQDGVNTSGKTTVIKSNRHTIIGFGCSSASSQIGMIGYSYRYRLVNNSYSTGSISGTGNNETRIGGIVGYNITSQVNNSYSTGSVSGVGNSNTNIGGIAGYDNSTSQVTNSYSTGVISGVGNSNTWVGGIVGYNITSQVNNSYSTGSISGVGNSNTWVGGIVGFNNINSQVTNCFGYGSVVAYNGASPLPVRGVYSNSSSFVSNCYQLGGDGVNETGYADEDDFKVKSNFAYTPTGLENDWNSTDAAAGNYDIGTVVKEGTIYYVSMVVDNTVQPSTDTLQASWQILGFDFINIWRMGKDYPELKIFRSSIIPLLGDY